MCKCDPDILESEGIFAQMQKNNKISEPLTLDEMRKGLKKLLSPPKSYSGTTICNRMTWVSDKREGIVTCNMSDCEICNSFNKALEAENKYGK